MKVASAFTGDFLHLLASTAQQEKPISLPGHKGRSANLSHHPLEGDVLVVDLVFAFPPFPICESLLGLQSSRLTMTKTGSNSCNEKVSRSSPAAIPLGWLRLVYSRTSFPAMAFEISKASASGESTTRSVERAPIEDKWKLVRPRRAISNLRFVRAESPNAVSSRPNLISSVHFVNDSVKPDHYNSTILSLSIRRSPEAYPSSNWISSMDPAISLHSSHVIRACTTFERHIIVTPMMPTACACVSNRTARTKRSSYRNAVALGEGCGFLLCFLKKNARSRS
ncbi:hypothetical protein BHM03_00042775 [Ensete ventricosum]|nr:hypothetical protein BHM03_00042775 [Ensete ventricosum]